jgi:hypothetical protein
MTDTIGSTPQPPQPPQPQPGSEPARAPRFRLPEPQQQSGGQAQPVPPPLPRPAAVRPNPGQAQGQSQGPGQGQRRDTPNAMTPPPEGRYGEKRGMSTPRKIGLAATGLAILGGVAGYIGWQMSHPAIQGTVTGYNATSTSVVVTFEVDKPADKSATCTLVAEDVHRAVIGSASVPVLAGRAKNVQSYTLKTTSTANTVIVQSCSLTS